MFTQYYYELAYQAEMEKQAGNFLKQVKNGAIGLGLLGAAHGAHVGMSSGNAALKAAKSATKNSINFMQTITGNRGNVKKLISMVPKKVGGTSGIANAIGGGISGGAAGATAGATAGAAGVDFSSAVAGLFRRRKLAKGAKAAFNPTKAPVNKARAATTSAAPMYGNPVTKPPQHFDTNSAPPPIPGTGNAKPRIKINASRRVVK